MKIGERETANPAEVAKAFNNFFSNIGSNLANLIPSTTKNPMDYLPDKVVNSFSVFPTTSKEIEDEISKLKSGKAVGPFSISTDVLKLLKSVLSKPLEILFISSFAVGIVPTDLKLANVIPVFKKGSQTLLSNYRPISLLSVFNKLLECLMYNRLIKYLEKQNILYEKQFGFRSKHSTDHAILSIVDKIQKAIENRNYSCGIFLDFSKAFDTVDHKIMLLKLVYYGVRNNTLKLFTSYFQDRVQYV